MLFLLLQFGDGNAFEPGIAYEGLEFLRLLLAFESRDDEESDALTGRRAYYVLAAIEAYDLGNEVREQIASRIHVDLPEFAGGFSRPGFRNGNALSVDEGHHGGT